MSAPSVAVCVPYRPRNDHDAALWSWCEARWRALFPDWQVCVADADPSAPFNRSASRNAAARMAPTADVYAFTNSDTVPLLASDVVTAVTIASDGGWTLPALYVEVNATYTDTALASEPGAPMVDPLSNYVRQLPASPAGPQIVSRRSLDEVGGWDELFGRGWCFDDTALRDALDVLCTPHERVGTSVHLFHQRTRVESVRDPYYRKNRERYGSVYRRVMAQRDPVARRAAMLAVVAGNRVADVRAGG